MHSCFYTGQVRHRRFTPRRHEFNYRLFYVYLDLDELDEVFNKRWFWSVKRPALARFKREDYLGDATIPLKQAVLDYVERETGDRPGGPVHMFTHLRYFGYVFNPVTFYYCYDTTAERLEYIVAEITNTPWGERHAYVLPVDKDADTGKVMQFALEKQFHISPFMPMNMRYDWRFSSPNEALYVHMNNHQDEEKVFDATLRMQRIPMSARNCAHVLVAFPMMTIKVIFGIYWQALRLYLKRVPFYGHPDSLDNSESECTPSRIKQEAN
jgi:DUF1365 family protein